MEATDQKIEKKTRPLHQIHQRMGAAFGEENGWTVPLHHGSPDEEEEAAQSRVAVGDLSPLGKIVLKGRRAEDLLKDHFPDVPRQMGVVVPVNDASRGKIHPIRLGRLTQNEYYLLTSPGGEEELMRSLSAARDEGSSLSWTDQTPGQVGLAIIGPYARAVIRKLTGLPLRPSALTDRQLAQTSFAKTHGIILRHDPGDIPGFEVFADRSYGEYLWEAVLDAGREWGIEPVGWKMLSELRPRGK